MTEQEKIEAVKALIGTDAEATDALITVYLTDAASAILRRLYPWGIPDGVTSVPSVYEMLQCKLAMRYFLRRGAEGEFIHDENGTNRHYGSVNDEDLLKEVVPYAKVFLKEG
jgi:hypothetical protein